VRKTLVQAQAGLGEIEGRLADVQHSLHESRQQVTALQSRAHALQVSTLKLAQASERFHERQAQIDASLAEMAAEEESESERLNIADAAIDRQRQQMQELQTLIACGAGAVRTDRAGVAGPARAAQGRNGSCAKPSSRNASAATSCRSWPATGSWRASRSSVIDTDLARCEENASALQADDLEPRLQVALDHRVAREHALANARDALEAAANGLRALDEERLKVEQSLDPLRNRIGELKLKEQAASLNFEQFAAQLAEANADESSLLPELAGTCGGPAECAYRAAALDRCARRGQPGRTRRTRSGPRTQGLSRCQSEDLTQAMGTLENAIRRIDRETRDLLQSTYDSVNRSFGELFPALFGGGEARLIMTGEEILDAGLQVLAQPPGKKNSTIHLLSGGEKALTAIALVFSMFQLNPGAFLPA
jgi:chromosome segregation protein